MKKLQSTHIGMLFGLIILAFLSGVCYIYLPLQASTSSAWVLRIMPNKNLHSVVAQLTQHRVNMPRLFSLYMHIRGDSNKIKVGEYKIDAGTTAYSLQKDITLGRGISYNFTIVDGWHFNKLKQVIDANPHLLHSTTAMQPNAIMDQLGLTGKSPEGQFYATTYPYDALSSDISIYRRAHELLVIQLQEQWLARSIDLPYSRAYDALIIASLIKRESAICAEYPLISAVVANRMRKSMPLQIDATVLFGLGRVGGGLSRGDLRLRTAYNTYRISGLPPTPIAMVAECAINAALHPATSDVLYYVAKGDGSGKHTFSKTHVEHLLAKRRYHLAQQQR